MEKNHGENLPLGLSPCGYPEIKIEISPWSNDRQQVMQLRLTLVLWHSDQMSVKLAFICVIYEKSSCVACPQQLMSVISGRNMSCDTAVAEQGRQPSRQLSRKDFIFFFFFSQMTIAFPSLGFDSPTLVPIECSLLKREWGSTWPGWRCEHQQHSHISILQGLNQVSTDWCSKLCHKHSSHKLDSNSRRQFFIKTRALVNK